MITIFLVDDQPSTRAVLRLRLELEADFTVLGEDGNDQDTVAQVIALTPDIVILDVSVPLLDEIAVKALLRQLASNSAVVVLTLYDDSTTREHVLAAGARAIVSKHGGDDLICAAIRAAANPAPSLVFPHD
jgi:DNA-binding NarL/FixJ family response regulator